MGDCLKTVLITEEISKSAIDYLKELNYKVIELYHMKNPILEKELEYSDAVIVRSQELTQGQLRSAQKLKVIAKHGIGLDKIDVSFATKKNILVVNTPYANVNSVAEHTLFLMLSVARKSDVVRQRFRVKLDYNVRNDIIGTELKNKILGLHGLGKIGSAVAQKAYFGFNMKVIAYDPFCNKEDVPDYIEFVDNESQLLKNADFISVHIPATPATAGKINETYFKKMKNTAYFINTARGELVVEKDLVFALNNNQIKGAGLDVFKNEKNFANNELLEMNNVIATPHQAALTSEALEEMGMQSAIAVHEVLTIGESPSTFNK